MKQTVDFTREVRDRQTTQDLRAEMYRNLEEHLDKLAKEEKARIDDITAATARKDDIQKQIDGINAYNKKLVDTNYSLALEDLNAAKYLNLDKNFDQKLERSKYRKPTYESKEFSWKAAEFQEPRVFNMKQIRDLFFGLMNQSMCQ